MNRGELYRVAHPSARDPKRCRVFVVVSRQVLIDSRFSTVICAPVYTAHSGLATEVPVGPDEGLKHDSSIHCDELVSLAKSMLTNYIGTLPPAKIEALDQALRVALDLRETLWQGEESSEW
ncbi:MAG: type II toxin-antitoxin system PemK/MazF family toxin [Planctomycetes bacterium]|nr:type II toxin-antitoxin system PemK/MazF family toxin [Planctomycetota bacterium]